MAAVEQPELREFVRRDIGDQRRAAVLEARPARGKAVLDHPLRERLGDDRPSVLDPESRGDARPILVRGGGNDAVDHRRGERDLALDPAAEIGIAQRGEPRDDRPRGRAVARQVVAADDRERREPRRAAARQRLDEKARRAHRRVGIGEVVADVGMAVVELARRRVVAIALLGDRQRDDADVARRSSP